MNGGVVHVPRQCLRQLLACHGGTQGRLCVGSSLAVVTVVLCCAAHYRTCFHFLSEKGTEGWQVALASPRKTVNKLSQGTSHTWTPDRPVPALHNTTLHTPPLVMTTLTVITTPCRCCSSPTPQCCDALPAFQRQHSSTVPCRAVPCQTHREAQCPLRQPRETMQCETALTANH
ncbi:hypothetical protein E2C01_024034 [Portunus trituberculatus]|uniref:Uncharacterized protein n=1 Tax=Portunus trituberculatus TaxID=210409 RepID=A0A5B7EC45_PORTR|nr:hypothetical protein [Portunus trituberculatus]